MTKINRSDAMMVRLQNEIESEICNKHAGNDVTMVWEMPLDYVVYPTGKTGIAGRLALSAPGYKAKTYLISADVYGEKWRAV